MLKSSEIFETLSRLKPTLQEDFSVRQIGVFGSFSDNTYSDESDIDLLVEFEHPIGWRFFTLELYLESVFGRKIDLVTINALKEQLREKILNQVKFV